MLAMGTDREKPYEQRIREWLGDSQSEFDIAVFPIRLVSPDDFAVRATAGSKTYSEDQYRFKDLFKQLEIESLVYSVVMLQRKTDGSTGVHDSPAVRSAHGRLGAGVGDGMGDSGR